MIDDTLIERVRRGEGMRGITASAIARIVMGAGAYGIAFGVWRAAEQALYSALKLPLMLLLVAVCTMGLGAMFAMMLRSRLSLRQTSACMLLSLAVTSIVLGSVAPISIALALVVPAGAPRVGHALLLWHVVVLAAAGTAGVVRLRALLARLGLEHVVARRVLVSWITAQFLVGSQLCWLLRPFFGEVGVRPTLFAHDVLRGNFFSAVATLMRSTFGAAAPAVFALAALAALVMLMTALAPDGHEVGVELGRGGLAVSDGRTIGWSEVVSVRCEGLLVLVELAPDETLARETLRVRQPNHDASRSLARRIDESRSRVDLGPFRTATVP